MKLLKKLITVASIVAMMATSAASFAAWEAEYATTTSSVGTGSVKLATFDSSTTVGITDLLPFDQEGMNDTAHASKVIEVDITLVSGATSANLQIKLGSGEDEEDTLVEGSALYAYVSATGAEINPNATGEDDDDFTWSSWISSGAVELTESAQTLLSVTTDGTYYVYFALKSDNIADMSKTINIEFSLANAA